MKRAFPNNYGIEETLVPIDLTMIPIICGALEPLEREYNWLTREDYERGYNAIAKVKAAMASATLKDLIESVNRVYRLIDTALNGTEYTYTESNDTPPIITIEPDMPIVPEFVTPAPVYSVGLRNRFERLTQLVQNIVVGTTYADNDATLSEGPIEDDSSIRDTLRDMQGMVNAGWFGIGGQPATLANVIEALRMGNQNDVERVTTALDVLVGASSTASIFDTVRGLFTETAEVGAEGAIVGTLIAGAMAQAAMLGMMSGQLDSIKQAISPSVDIQNIAADISSIRSQLENNPTPDGAAIIDRLDQIVSELS